MHLEKRQRTGSANIVTSKNPFQIGYTDGIFAVQLMFSYGQRSKCADLLTVTAFL